MAQVEPPFVDHMSCGRERAFRLPTHSNCFEPLISVGHGRPPAGRIPAC